MIYLSDVFVFSNGDYSGWADGNLHLVRNGVNLLDGIEATECFSYKCMAFDYIDKEGYYHLIYQGIDYLADKKAKEYNYNANMEFDYILEDGSYYTFTVKDKDENNEV